MGYLNGRFHIMTAFLALFLSSGCEHTHKVVWKEVDEGFKITIPASWKRSKWQPIDSNSGDYRGWQAELHFDEWLDVAPESPAPRTIKNRKRVEHLKAAQQNPKLLTAGEEVWTVDRRTASFRVEEVDPELRKQVRGFGQRASLFVPYTDRPGYLSITIFFKDAAYLPTVRDILQSVRWKTTLPQARSAQ